MPADPWVLLLRGVNVGGHRKLPMAGLRDLLSGLGCSHVVTHIQSGNAIFVPPEQATGDAAEEAFALRVTEAIEARFGFRPKTMVMPLARVDAILAACPFEWCDDGGQVAVQIGFLAAPATGAGTTARLDELAALCAPDEAIHLDAGAFYLRAPSGIGRSAVAEKAERLLGVPMTMRNLRVVRALQALGREVPPC